ncbi:MAG: hypothetical protein Phog2KO_46020 [Phototrophicaceae bacterium]
MKFVVTLEYPSTFCLKPSNVTDRSGKSLLLPTPYAIKMSLLDVLIQYQGLEKTRQFFPEIKEAKVWWIGPQNISIFRAGVSRRSVRANYGTKRINQEFCQYFGKFKIILDVSNVIIMKHAWTLNRLGRSGSIVNVYDVSQENELPSGAIELTQPYEMSYLSFGLMQRMDNLTSSATFEQINTMNEVQQKNTRVQFDIVIPYRIIQSGYNHTLYERL